MFCFSLYGHGITQGAAGIDQLFRRQTATASLALITVSIFISADRARACYVPVSQKCLCFFIIILLGLFFFKQAIIIHFFKKCGGCFMMDFIGSAGVDVKRNSHLLKAFLDDRMAFID